MMKSCRSIFDRIFHSLRSDNATPKKKLSHRHPGFETLENRQLLTVCGVTATDSLAVEGGQDNATFLISRDTVASTSLTVGFRVNGTAAYNSSASSSDYRLYTSAGAQIYLYQSYDSTLQTYFYAGNVTIPANQTNVTIEVRPINDGNLESDEMVTISITEEAGNSSF